MLKLGQMVIIDELPTYGQDYFDRTELGLHDRVYAMRAEGDKILYQLSCQPGNCWWLYDSVTGTDEYTLDSIPQFDLGDEVVRTHSPGVVKTVTTVSVNRGGFKYTLDNETSFVTEYALRLYRKKDEPSSYSLF